MKAIIMILAKRTLIGPRLGVGCLTSCMVLLHLAPFGSGA